MEEGKLASLLKALNPKDKKDKNKKKKKCEKCVCVNDKCANHPKKEKTKDTHAEVSDNVLDYICMQEAGHFRYGWGFISVQVNELGQLNCNE